MCGCQDQKGAHKLLQHRALRLRSFRHQLLKFDGMNDFKTKRLVILSRTILKSSPLYAVLHGALHMSKSIKRLDR